MAFGGTGPTQPLIGAVLKVLPSAFLMVNVPQNANEVRVEPVVLLMAIVRSEVRVAPATQVTQPVPVIAALTSSKSLEVHLLALGKVCARTAFESISPATVSRNCSQPMAANLLKEFMAMEYLENSPCEA